MKYTHYVKAGDQFAGYQKSLSKKAEYFFSELEVVIRLFTLRKSQELTLNAVLSGARMTVSNQ